MVGKKALADAMTGAFQLAQIPTPAWRIAPTSAQTVEREIGNLWCLEVNTPPG